MPGKHHCSCEVEEEIEQVKTPAHMRQRRRSQASMPSASSSSDTVPTNSNSNEGVANESTKRSSGLSVMPDEYLYTNDSVGGTGSNSGSLKRRRPVLDNADESASTFQGRLWHDLDSRLEMACTMGHTNGMNCNSSGSVTGGTGGAASYGQSPLKGATAPMQLQPPLSKQELEDVLAVLRCVACICETIVQLIFS